MSKVEVGPEPLRHYPCVFAFAGFNCPIDFSTEVKFPKWGQITLNHDIIVQENHFVKVGEELTEKEKEKKSGMH